MSTAYGGLFLKGHGTAARYRRHLRDGEKACRACKDAHAQSVRLNKANRKASA